MWIWKHCSVHWDCYEPMTMDSFANKPVDHEPHRLFLVKQLEVLFSYNWTQINKHRTLYRIANDLRFVTSRLHHEVGGKGTLYQCALTERKCTKLLPLRVDYTHLSDTMRKTNCLALRHSAITLKIAYAWRS